MSVKLRRMLDQSWRYLVVILVLSFFLFPVMWITLTAFKTGEEFLKSPPVWIPQTPSLRSFQFVIEAGGLHALRNSVIISGGATLLALFLGSMAGYGLARYKPGGQDLPFFFLR